MQYLSRFISAMIAAMLIAVMPFATPASAQGLKFHLPSGRDIRAAIDRLPPDQQLNLRQAAAEVFPLFVFIPGIMGSRLTKTLPNGTEKLIWGQFQGIFAKPDRDIAYSENDIVKAEVMNEYFALNASFDIYGKAVEAIRYMDLTMGDNVRLFAYDWRQPNSKSAKDFAAWLCKNRDEIQSRPLVLLAHSMGGLVLKSWLKNIYESEGCKADDKFSDWVKIKKVFFLGTPHYGAPKAVMAFADQYSLLVDPDDSTMSRWLGGLDAVTLSKSINAYGVTFPSAYELLPVVNTNACFKEAGWPFPISIKQANGTPHTDVDLFHPGTWNVFRWPKNLAPDLPRDKFVSEKLPYLLRSARDFLCDLSHFQPDNKFDVVRISGGSRKTICSVTINQPSTVGDVATVTPQFCNKDEGDGTVPKWVASEDKFSKADKVRTSGNGHMYLVGSPEFLEYLESYKNELHRELQSKYAVKTGSIDGLVTMYASLRTAVPSASGLNDPNDVSLQVARRVIAEIGVPPSEIYNAAKSESDPVSRANAYRIFADVAPVDNTSTRAWAFNNAAHIYLSRKDFVAARDFGKLAVQSADKKKVFDVIKARAGVTTAVAAEQLNDFATASTYRDVAVNPRSFEGFRELLN